MFDHLLQKFRTFVLESEKSVDLIAYLLFYCVEIKDKPRMFSVLQFPTHTLKPFAEQHGVCRAISYIVQTLSAEPAFGPQLSKPIRAQIPTKWGPVDTTADFIIHVSKCGSKSCLLADMHNLRLFTQSLQLLLAV